nr:endothelin-converting enzyme 1-like [Penaeus vannamei]
MREGPDAPADGPGLASSSRVTQRQGPRAGPADSRLPKLNHIYTTFRELARSQVKANGTTPGHAPSPTVCEAGGGGAEDMHKPKRTWTERWVMGVSVAGVVVSGLVLIIVLFPLLTRKTVPTPAPTASSPNIPADVVRLQPDSTNEDSISPGERIILADRDVFLEGRKSSGLPQEFDADPNTSQIRKFYKLMADNIKGSMNRSSDPCQDFYEYACGNWHQHVPPPQGVSRWSNFEAMTITIWELMEDQLKRAASSEIGGTSPDISFSEEFKDPLGRARQDLLEDADPFMLELAGRYYAACENETQLATLGAGPLQEVLRIMDEQYRSLLQKVKPLEAFQRMLEYVHHDLAVHAFFSWKVEVDNSVADSMAIEISAPSLDLIPQGTKVEGNEELITVYQQYATDLLKIVGTFEGRDVAAEVEDILAMLKVYQPLSGSPLVNDTTVQELEAIAPFLNWQSFFNAGFNPLGIFVSQKERILSLVQDYLAVLSTNILEEISQEGSARRLYAFLRWQVAQNYAQYLHKSARNTILPLFDGITGENTTSLPHFRYRPCIKELEERLALPIAYLLMEIIKGQLHKQHDIKDMVNKVTHMAENIRDEYKRFISSFKWLKDKDKNMLVEKLNNVKILVGYPPVLDNVLQLRSLFKELHFTHDNLLQNQINLLKFNQQRKMKFLRQPETYTEWEVLSPMSLISFYVYRRNALLVPLGGFMYPLYSSYIPEPLTYATMGVFISHELGHSIDFVGRTRDSLGRANATLWDESTVEDFVERVLCRVNEYSEKHYAINGLLTIAEVMADDGSVINAYMTTQKQLQHTKFPGQLEHLMDQLAMTPDQLFFLYYAQLFCTTSPDGTPAKGVEHYPPHSVRVTATLTKSSAFHSAYQCKEGSGMNPDSKNCEIW